MDKENRYSAFNLISLPYPGCEFFREFRDNNYSHESLVFDWSQGHVNAEIGVPIDNITSQLLNINWEQYRAWDLVTITQNYLKLCLKYLQENSSGLLIHCISGWDRTPLFISLLRISLWADGVCHQSLNAMEIIYLTIAYDWYDTKSWFYFPFTNYSILYFDWANIFAFHRYLFGHDLPDRLSKGEEIFVFCFYALKYIQEEDFSILGHRHRSKHNSSGSSSIAVLHTDGESNLEGFLFDGDSRGSSVSLNSLGSQQESNQQSTTCVDGFGEYTNGYRRSHAVIYAFEQPHYATIKKMNFLFVITATCRHSQLTRTAIAVLKYCKNPPMHKTTHPFLNGKRTSITANLIILKFHRLYVFLL